MIVTLVLFGLFCVFGAIIIMTFFGAATGNFIGTKLHRDKKGHTLSPLDFVIENSKKVAQVVQAKTAKSEPKKFYLKLGNQKVEIERHEVAKAKKDGYEVLEE